MAVSRRNLFQHTLGLGAFVVASQSSAKTREPIGSPVGYRASTENRDLSIINLDLLEEQSRGKMTEYGYAFVSGGAGDEWTLRENRRAFDDYPIVTHRMTGTSSKTIDTRLSLAGTHLPSPIIVAPMGMHGIVHAEAEIATAAGAGAVGTLYQCSGASNRPLEEIAKATSGPKWFQLYFNNDLGITRSILQRAAAAGYTAIVLTVDALGPGVSDRVRRLRQRFPQHLTFANHDPKLGGSGDLTNQKQDLTWVDIQFCREVSGLPVIVKGILRPEDAILAVKAGAAGVQVSNHGGRQVDGLPASIHALPRIADALKGETSIIIDGGVRRGIDVFRALAMGANAVAVGRPILYGLGAGGSGGVKGVLEFLNAELKTAMLLAGVDDLKSINRGSIFQKA